MAKVANDSGNFKRPTRRMAWYTWFPSDFLSETRAWSALQKGLYRELLDAQWDMGDLPEAPAELRRIAQYTESEWRQAWTKDVEAKFPLAEGRRANPRLEEQRQEAVARYEKQRTAARRANAVRWHGDGAPGNRNRTRIASDSESQSDRESTPIRIPVRRPIRIPSTTTATCSETTPRNTDVPPKGSIR